MPWPRGSEHICFGGSVNELRRGASQLRLPIRANDRRHRLAIGDYVRSQRIQGNSLDGGTYRNVEEDSRHHKRLICDPTREESLVACRLNIIRKCRTCGQRPRSMFYARLRNGMEQFYVCITHTPMPMEKYAIVEIDNRPGRIK